MKDWHVLNREAARARMTQGAPDSQPSAATGNNPQQSAATAPGILPGPEPTAPELSPMEVVHRHQDGIVTFHVKNADGEFENLFGIRAEDLQDMFPEFKQQLEADAYYSLNAYYHPEKRRRARIKATEARRPDRLKYLCAVYCDLDCHKSGVKFGSALGTIINYQDDGKIPAASVMVRSGRGMWLLYLLRDARNPELPQKAWAEKVIQYVEINRALGQRLANLEADALKDQAAMERRLGVDVAARDALRVTRVPGSVNSKAVDPAYPRVKYWVQSGDCQHPVTYTLDQLAAAFGVKPKLDETSQRAFAAATLPKGSRKRGPTGTNMRRLRDFGVLRAKRGGFADGHRNNASLVYALLLRANGADRDAVMAAVDALGQECRPPLDQPTIRNAVKSVFARTDSGSYQFHQMKDSTIADLLNITSVEAGELEEMPCASRFRVIDVHVVEPLSQERRRLLIERLIQTAGGVPTSRKMAELLAVEGHEISQMQVIRDYKGLGIESGRERQKSLLL